jgi:hypothetical protein
MGERETVLLDLVGVNGYSGSPVVVAETGAVIGVVYGRGAINRIVGFEWVTPISAVELQRALTPQGTP